MLNNVISCQIYFSLDMIMNSASVPPNPKMGGPKQFLKLNLRGQNNDFGTKGVFGPHE